VPLADLDFDPVLAHLDTAGERAEMASKMRHEIARRLRREALLVVQIRCYTCRLVKHDEEFGRNRGRPNGRQAQCRSCASEQNAAQRAVQRAAKVAATPVPLDPAPPPPPSPTS
jgi:hypothetical protein